MHYLRSLGYISTRSAGSHGPVDILSARMYEYDGKPEPLSYSSHRRVLTCQVKKYKFTQGILSRDEFVEFVRWANAFNATPILVTLRKTEGKRARELEFHFAEIHGIGHGVIGWSSVPDGWLKSY